MAPEAGARDVLLKEVLFSIRWAVGHVPSRTTRSAESFCLLIESKRSNEASSGTADLFLNRSSNEE